MHSQSKGPTTKSRRSLSPRMDASENRGSSKSRRENDSSSTRHSSSSSKKTYHHHYSRESRNISPQRQEGKREGVKRKYENDAKHHSTSSVSSKRPSREDKSKKTGPTRSSSNNANHVNDAKNVEKSEMDLEGSASDEQEMLKLMGFGNFDSTKGKKVPGNNVSAVHVIHKRKYRQYMNRKGGFNRPLDFVA
ncbi:U4/U6.U5 small nuclear ribonucleoprotein 27 kDa protein [Tetranychus urticae]|uniref:U4/U6.U5 small nuclear ribonucleoprotein 27 kDa protein n=1 Tax=Tetranychus urticae TaxID=32264 RepID=T1KEC5_TETUR|nr:U4/U6.U5 small nuclear ribonucleoprotein 27 kDa protein [Tetranychus urticae]